MCPSSSSSPKTTTHSGTPRASTIVDRIVGVCLFLYTLPGFAFFRSGEIGSLISCYKNECISVLIGTTIIGLSLRTRRAKNLLHFISLILLVYVLDVYVTKPLPVPNESYENKTIVITGSNAGVGYETARQLAVDYGMNVIMGCRSEAKCNNAADSIKNEIVLAKSSGDVTPYIIDLSNLDSVETFSSQIQIEGRQIDVLFNNAGYVPGVGQPVNEYGLDPAFTSMHLAHFYLTELLLKENPNMRVVNTSSGTHHMCAMPFGRSIALRVIREHPGCLNEKYLKTGIRSETDEAAYYQSKIANVMHVVEIPRNHPQATAVAIDLGWVGTSIQSFMTFSVVSLFLCIISIFVFICFVCAVLYFHIAKKTNLHSYNMI